MKLIVGLGNPGEPYEGTRHNLGFLIVDRLAVQNHIAMAKGPCDSIVGEGSCGGVGVVLAKPQTFMNLSGSAVGCLIETYHGSTDDLVVIYDDLDLPFGRLRIRPHGGAGGHRGVLSVSERLAGAPFCRVRMGIGRPPAGIDAVDYVLERFDSQESAELDKIVDRAAESVVALLRDGLERAMACYNQAE
ncbi:MAG TPA: aminoacyl-tRNA hydrolase [Candidatus Binatia bacterium]|jgi:PTH1 family peptidyl-tRNA hydrolase